MRARFQWLVACCVAALPIVAATTVHGASDEVEVSLELLGVNSINLAGCTTGTPDVTDFGEVFGTAPHVTGSDCTVEFGSNLGTARLLIAQSDGVGVAAWQPSSAELDTGFGGDGTASVAIAPGSANDLARAMAVQADGRIVLAGYCAMGGSTGTDFCLARFNPDGTLDTTFAGDGRLSVAIAPGSGGDNGRDIAIQDDGRIIVAGSCSMGGSTGVDFCLVRVNPNGTLDTTFAGDGRLTIAIAPGTGNDTAWAVEVQPDGHIVAGGRCDSGGPTGRDMCLARITPDGTLDTTFAGDGTLLVDIAPGSGVDLVRSLAIQDDGRILAAGECDMGAMGGLDFCAARLNPDGTLDTGFAGDGKFTLAIAPGNGIDGARSVAIQPDGRIVLAGGCEMGGATGYDFCVARLEPDGTLDGSFAGDGTITIDIAPGGDSDYGRAVTIQPDGAIVVAGRCDVGGSTGTDMCIARTTPDGTMDEGFAEDGRLILPVAPGSGDEDLEGVALGPDGRIVVAGHCDMGGPTGWDFCVAVLAGGATLGQYVEGTSDWDTAGTSHFAACLRAVEDATATWTANATCPASTGAWWNAVPESPGQVAEAGGPASGTVHMRFGLRLAPAQELGAYVAPMTLTVASP